MAEMINHDAPTVWLLVKVPRVIDLGSGEDRTAMSLRVSVQNNHFGGERASVRRLSKKEIRALQFVKDSRPAIAEPVEEQTP